MKSFFKKLAFVMAMAMVVSMAAPAAQRAAAATEFTYAEQNEDGSWAGTGKVSSLTMKAGDKVDLGFVGVRDYKNYTLKWVSSNEAVATVDKNGVITAVADGTARVELQVGDGTDYVSTPVVVTVGEVMNVVLGTAKDDTFTEKTLKVGESIDLNFYGVTDWAAGKYACTWVSTDESVATVDKMGNVEAREAGTTRVTVVIQNKETGAVLNVMPVEFTVVDDTVDQSFTAKQTTDSKAVVTFANKELTKEEVNKDTLEVYYYISGIDNPIYFPAKNVTDIKDGVATVEFYSDFEDGVTYELRYKEEAYQFVATIGTAVRVDFTWKTDGKDKVAYVDKEVTLVPTLYNAAGVDITASVFAKGGSVRFDILNADDNSFYGYDTTLFFTEAGKTAIVKAVYVTGQYNDDGTEKASNVEWTQRIISEEAPQYTMETGLVAFTIGKKADWDHINKTLSVSDIDNYRLFVKVKDINGKEQVANFDDSNSDANKNGTWRFQSSNENKLSIGSNGELMPNETGSVSVLVYYQPYSMGEQDIPEKFVCALPIAISAERAPASITVDGASSIVLSSEAGSNSYNTGKITFVIKDALNAPFEGAEVSITANSKATNKPSVPDIVVTNGDGKAEITIVANNQFDDGITATVQSYSYTVKCNNRTASFTVNVRKPDVNGKVSGYIIEFSGDNNIKAKGNASFTAHLVAQSNGISTNWMSISGKKTNDFTKVVDKEGYYYTITKNGKDVTADVADTNVTVRLTSTATASAVTTTGALMVPTFIKKSDSTGDYVVTFWQPVVANDKVIGYKQVGKNATFKVEDKRDAMTYIGKETNSYTKTNASMEDKDIALAVVTNCLKFKLGGTELKKDNWKVDQGDILFDIDYNPVTGSTIYIKKVTFYVPVDGGIYEMYEVKVGTSVTIR